MSRIRATAVAALAATAAATSLGAQEPAASFAPHGHWTRVVIRRIALDGGIDAGAATAAWPLRDDVIARLLSASDAQGDRADTAVAATLPRDALGGFARLFARERNDLLNDRRVRLALRAGPAFDGRRDQLRAGNSVPDAEGYFYPGPSETEDRRDFAAIVDIDAAWSALALRATLRPPHEDVGEAYLAASFGSIAVWAGKRGLSIGATARGGLVLGDAARFSGGGLETVRPFRLPFLAVLGDVRVSQTLARMERSGAVDDPWFLATRISLSPHERFALGLNRATIFGGDGNDGVNARRVLLMLLGFSDVAGKDSDFENQIASVDVWWRAPVRIPLALYAEYGTEDTGLAFVHVPSLLVGVEAAPRAGGPSSAALEHVRFARSTRTYPEWYRHGALGGGWSDDGALLGHALGGHGHETSLELRYDDAARSISTRLRLLVRDRGEENLFAPDRAGSAAGAEARVAWFAAARLRFELAGSAEVGDGWTAGRLRVFALRTF